MKEDSKSESAAMLDPLIHKSERGKLCEMKKQRKMVKLVSKTDTKWNTKH